MSDYADQTVAVLAVQGAFAEHEARLSKLGARCIEMRQAADLKQDFDRLVLPGGESTVQGKLLEELGMLEGLRARIAEGMPVLGTCAGLILLARDLAAHDDKGTPRLATMDVLVERNAYGRQLGSFRTKGQVAGIDGEVPLTFIRAPRIVEVHGDTEALAEVDGRIVAARQGNQLGVTFHPELDDDTRLHELVSAKDKGTGKEQQITISGSTALSDDEVDRMVKDAEAHAEEDKKQKEEVEVRNQTDSLCYSTEQTLNELGDKVSADVKSKAEAAIADAKKALEGSDVEAIKAAGESLQSVAYELAQVVYADAQQQTDGAAGAQPADDDVVDADYEVVDDEDK